MNLKTKHENTIAELKAAHGNCFNSEFRVFKKGGFVCHLQFTKSANSHSKSAIQKRLDSFLKTVKSQIKTPEKSS